MRALPDGLLPDLPLALPGRPLGLALSLLWLAAGLPLAMIFVRGPV